MKQARAKTAYTPVSLGSNDYHPGGVVPPPEPLLIPADRMSPSPVAYLWLAGGLLLVAALLAAGTVGVPLTFVHFTGMLAMVTSALATLLVAGAMLALRSALGGRRQRI